VVARVSGAANEGAGVPSVVGDDDAVTASPAVTGTFMSAESAARPLPTEAETGPLLADRDALVRTEDCPESSAFADPTAVDAARRGVARGPAFLLAFDPFEDELGALESVDPAVSARAIAGIETSAAPTPRATASAPTRPTPSAVFADELLLTPEPLNELTKFLSRKYPPHGHCSGASYPGVI